MEVWIEKKNKNEGCFGIRSEWCFGATWKARWESVRLTFDWKRKDDAVVCGVGQSGSYCPFCHVS